MGTRPYTEPGADPARFTLSPEGEERGTLRFAGRNVGEVKGVELVAHFPVADVGWLVVTDCDCPFEETVFLHLLGPDLSRLDTLSLGGAYTPGIVEGVEPAGPGRFRILFPGRDQPQLVTVGRRRTGLLGRLRWLHVEPG